MIGERIAVSDEEMKQRATQLCGNVFQIDNKVYRAVRAEVTKWILQEIKWDYVKNA